jgi:hypothetical protein
MINNIKSELEKRTGLPANVVDQVVNTLGEIISEKYPQYAGIIGPILGIPTTGATGASATTGGSGMPDLGNLGGLLSGLEHNQTGQGNSSQQSNTPTKG